MTKRKQILLYSHWTVLNYGQTLNLLNIEQKFSFGHGHNTVFAVNANGSAVV
jgi:hypothetical protein